ncbi:MAG: DUF433 domain-containing protein [Bacteroidota bacterium]
MEKEQLITKIISSDIETMGGTPVFSGTRVAIKSFFDYLEIGESLEEFLENFPTVSKEQVLGLLTLAEQVLVQQFAAHEGIT